MVIAFVDIEIVRELAYTATIGVTVMIITNKMLLPILLSYYKFSPEQASKLAGKETAGDWLWERLGPLADRRSAWIVLLVGLALLGFGISQAMHRHIGDLGTGVPELKPDARYNQDVEMIVSHFAIGVDNLQVIAEAKAETEDDSPCVDREVMERVEDFEFQMRQVDGVATVRSLSGFVKSMTQSFAETFSRWRMLPESRAQIAQGVGYATRLGNEFMNSRCTAMPINVYTVDHQAQTIAHIVDRIHAFKAGGGDTEKVTFRLASGNVGVMAATNEAVHAADKWVNLALFLSVGFLCLLTFRSLRLTLCVILPLALVTVLCNAVMAMLDIGLKVNTLPVVALGVGVGVDYGIYLFERIKHEMEHGGLSLKDAYVEALKQRGHGVAVHRRHHDHLGRHLVLLGAEVPGGHGHPAGLHVPRERVRCDPAGAGDCGLPGEARYVGDRRRPQPPRPDDRGRSDSGAGPAQRLRRGGRAALVEQFGTGLRGSASARLDRALDPLDEAAFAAADELAADSEEIALAGRAGHAVRRRQDELGVMQQVCGAAVGIQRIERVVHGLERLFLQALSACDGLPRACSTRSGFRPVPA